MKYEEYESSIAQGRPVRLYLFERNASVYWAYTNADRELNVDGYRYMPEAIEDDGFKQTGEPNNDTVKVTVPIQNDISKMFKGYHPSEEIMLTVRELDWNDITQTIIVWVGSIASVSMTLEGTAEIICSTFDASLQRNALKRTYNRSCDHAIYSAGGCRLDKTQYAVQATITALDGASFACNMATPPKAGLNYGFVQWKVLDGRATETRGIEFEQGGRVHLLGGTAGLKVGMAITLYPGCDQTSKTCQEIFNNFANYGGFRKLPGRSPFDGSPIM